MDLQALHYLRETPVEFLGFRSDLARLYSEGWECQMQRQVHDDMTVHLLICHRDLELSSTFIERERYASYREPIRIRGINQAKRMNFSGMKTIEAPYQKLVPAFSRGSDLFNQKMDFINLFDLLDFEKPQELIVESKDVQYHLDQILSLQRPKQREMRDKARHVKKTEAKIISFMEYASG